MALVSRRLLNSRTNVEGRRQKILNTTPVVTAPNFISATEDGKTDKKNGAKRKNEWKLKQKTINDIGRHTAVSVSAKNNTVIGRWYKCRCHKSVINLGNFHKNSFFITCTWENMQDYFCSTWINKTLNNLFVKELNTDSRHLIFLILYGLYTNAP